MRTPLLPYSESDGDTLVISPPRIETRPLIVTPAQYNEEQREKQALQDERLMLLVQHWRYRPVDFFCHVFGIQPDPWQADVLDAIAEEDNVAICAARGVGKSMILGGVIIWFTTTRENARVPTTAPTFNKHVRDALWGQWVHYLWRRAQERQPWFVRDFELMTTRLQHKVRPAEWFAVGIASNAPINMEGYRSDHLLIVFDEAKAIAKSIYDAAQGSRTTREAKMVVGSTPGAVGTEFHKIITQYRTTWKSTFMIHPIQMKDRVKAEEATPYSKRGTYYSTRLPDKLLDRTRLEWGVNSPIFVTQMIGLFADSMSNSLLSYSWVQDAEHREQGKTGPRVVSCDPSRFGRDRTVMLVGEGGTLLHGETLSHFPEQSTSPEARTVGVGDDPKRPEYMRGTIIARACQRLRRDWDADCIVVDEVGVGAAVCDILRSWGERVIEISFGASPPDMPKDEEDRKLRERRHQNVTEFANFKAWLGVMVADAYERGDLAFASCCRTEKCVTANTPCDPDTLLTPLLQQSSLMAVDRDSRERLHLVDPDEQDDQLLGEEAKKSPDHFHALMLYWYGASGLAKVQPRAGRVIETRGPARIGERRGSMSHVGVGQTPAARAGAVGGQAAHVRNWYSGRR